ncbi:unnamed protein product, partial [Rotaria sordida]
QLMINIDLSTNIMNNFNDTQQAKDPSLKEFVGYIVLIPYNNETYRILDIAWNKPPNFQFTRRNGIQ